MGRQQFFMWNPNKKFHILANGFMPFLNERLEENEKQRVNEKPLSYRDALTKKASAWRTQRPTRKETYTTPPQVWYKALTSSESVVSDPFDFLLFPVGYT